MNKLKAIFVDQINLGS